ncbi:glycosyltransferase family 2 protein, partial [Bacillus tequilensis]
MSIIIPVYNGEKYLRDCLDSVLGQTLKNIEVLIVDDGSTDSTRNILKCYEAFDKRVKPIY